MPATLCDTIGRRKARQTPWMLHARFGCLRTLLSSFIFLGVSCSSPQTPQKPQQPPSVFTTQPQIPTFISQTQPCCSCSINLSNLRNLNLNFLNSKVSTTISINTTVHQPMTNSVLMMPTYLNPMSII